MSGDQISTIKRLPHLIVEEGGVADSTVFDAQYFFDSNGNQTQENSVWKAPAYTSGQIP